MSIAQVWLQRVGGNSQALGNGENYLPMRDRKTNIFSDVDACHKRPLLMAGWAGTSLLARKGNEHFMFAVRAAYSSKTFMQIAALEIGCHGSLDHRAPETVLALKSFIVGLLEGVKMLVDQTPQFGCTRIPWLVQYGQFGTGGNHEENALSGSRQVWMDRTLTARSRLARRLRRRTDGAHHVIKLLR